MIYSSATVVQSFNEIVGKKIDQIYDRVSHINLNGRGVPRTYNIRVDGVPVSDDVYVKAALIVAKYPDLVDEADKELSLLARRMECKELNQFLSTWNWKMRNSTVSSGSDDRTTYSTPLMMPSNLVTTPRLPVSSPPETSLFSTLLPPYYAPCNVPLLPDVNAPCHIPGSAILAQGDLNKNRLKVRAPPRKRAPKAAATEIHKCSECPEQFDSRRKLQNHLKAHSGKKAFFCDLCVFAAGQMRAVTAHKKRVHKIDPASVQTKTCESLETETKTYVWNPDVKLKQLEDSPEPFIELTNV